MHVLRSLVRVLACAALLLVASNYAFAQGSPIHQLLFRCDQQSGILCTEQLDNPGGWKYVGHDEPSLLFYSREPGAGYANIYKVRLPKDPPLKPKQDGSGGTWNFQLRPTFWFGMAMCDDQSAPNPGDPMSAQTSSALQPVTATSLTNQIRKTRITSESTPVRRLWRCSSTHQAGSMAIA